MIRRVSVVQMVNVASSQQGVTFSSATFSTIQCYQLTQFSAAHFTQKNDIEFIFIN